MPKRPLSSIFWSFIEENQKSLVLLLLLISLTGGIVGYRTYKETQEDPEFCKSCHMMQEAFKTWQMSRHRDVTCQKCHIMSLLEQNRMLIAYVVRGTRSAEQKHGRVSPWRACRKCHLSEMEQGSLNLNNSYGHARHVFMLEIDCGRCHTANLHTFKPDQNACAVCHKDKIIHGMGMAGLSCLNCHSYGEKAPKMITSERCRQCHKNIPANGAMSSLRCFECHHPHGQIKPSSQDCLKNCHGNEARIGQHNLHMTKAQLGCLDCHKAHGWSIGKKEAKNLCNRCHALKDPGIFIN